MDGIKNHTKPPGPVEPVTNRVQHHAARQEPIPPPAASATAGERVTLTQGAKALMGGGMPDSGNAPVNLTRVAALRQAIDEGSYVVDPARVAERLLRAERDR
jgi:flagellar biosynthesis anti-sigma factor FlgM